MALSLSPSHTQRLDHTLEASLKQSIGETVGDIPLYSLHRIRFALQREPPKLSAELMRVLSRLLVEANDRYREESGNRRWYCLTSHNLVEALTAFDDHITAMIAGVESAPDEQEDAEAAMIAGLRAKQVAAVDRVKHWFDARSDRLLYDMSGKVPWAVVLRLRRGLGAWIAGMADVFKSDIEDTILDVAREQGVHTDDPEDAWKRMGGTVFTKGRKR